MNYSRYNRLGKLDKAGFIVRDPVLTICRSLSIPSGSIRYINPILSNQIMYSLVTLLKSEQTDLTFEYAHIVELSLLFRQGSCIYNERKMLGITQKVKDLNKIIREETQVNFVRRVTQRIVSVECLFGRP